MIHPPPIYIYAAHFLCANRCVCGVYDDGSSVQLPIIFSGIKYAPRSHTYFSKPSRGSRMVATREHYNDDRAYLLPYNSADEMQGTEFQSIKDCNINLDPISRSSLSEWKKLWKLTVEWFQNLRLTICDLDWNTKFSDGNLKESLTSVTNLECGIAGVQSI